MNNKKNIQDLLTRYAAGKCTEEELVWIETWYNQQKTDPFTDLSDEDIEMDLHEVFQKLAQQKPRPWYAAYRVAAAAVLVIGLGIGLYNYYPKLNSGKLPAASSQLSTKPSVDIALGGNKAVLTLADGTVISLDDISTGQVAHQEGITIDKAEDGLITYTVAAKDKEPIREIIFNTISTPKGGQYRVVLSDGTKVWLNAASTLKFPATFSANERSVELVGEGYFEVNQQHTKSAALVPFIIISGNQRVRVLGTKFNINSYTDEPAILTTLLEGSIEVSDLTNQNKRVLKPNEQARLTANNVLQVTAINPAQAVAWKGGLFQFQNTDIKTVMRQISRWYDVDVEFDGETPDIKLWGEVYRNVNASEVLEILEYFNLKYKIIQDSKGKKIVIS